MIHIRISVIPPALVAALFFAQVQTGTPTPADPQPSLASSPSPSSPGDSTRLEVIKAPQPDYPLEAAAKHLQGQVWIKLHISETGDVASTEIVSGEPILAKAAAEAMKQWKFKPFIKDGKPVKISRNMPFDFVLKGNFAEGCAAAEAAALANAKHHLQVSREVVEGSLVHKVNPEYPVIARMKRVQGTVLLLAIIGKDGRIQDLKALCGPPELVPASLAAVRQWRYRPYLLEGNPVAVETTVKVQFHM